MSMEEMLDWAALYEINPWGDTRADMRAAVQSVWNRGATFDDLRPTYPYIESDTEQFSEEDEAEFVAYLSQINRNLNAPAGAAESKTDRVG